MSDLIVYGYNEYGEAVTEAVDVDPPAFGGLAEIGNQLDRIKDDELASALSVVRNARDSGRRIFFIGNGASASIASHMAADFLKTGGMAAQCFNDGALLTCLANDLGYEHSFEVPLAAHARAGDLLFAISSSGASTNIINATQSANALGCVVVTLTGFSPDNPLRKLGAVNFYVPSQRYGVVEVVHHAICHAILDEVVNAAAA